MDEDRLAAALRSATDDVQVPRDLVRRAERLGRARRARRRSAVTTLAVGVVVLAGGALVLPQIGSGGGASSTSGTAASSAVPAPPPVGSVPRSAQDPAPDRQAAGPSPAAGQSASCDPSLVVDGFPARQGDATPVRAGDAVEIAGPPLCGPAHRDGRHTLVLVPRGSTSPTVLAEVVPAADGSFVTDVTVPASTPPGPARLSVTASPAADSACRGAGCTGPSGDAELDVLPPDR